jgi:hypothetical protein
MTAIAEITARYIETAVASHLAATISEARTAEATAAKLARDFGLDEMALESQVLDAVFTGMTDADLASAVKDPSRRVRARAEIARRNA